MGDKDRLEVKIAQIAARQQRNITRPQLIGLGMASTSITRWVRIGRLYREHPGVYSVGAPATTPLEKAMAAVLACGPGAALSHGSALALWGIWKRWDRPFDVIVNTDRRPRGVRVHRTTLERRDVTRQHGIPVTTLARALLDMAPRMTPKSLNRAVNNGRQEGYVRVDGLRDLARRYPTHRGTKKLARCVGLAPERPSRSQFEDDFLAFCERHGLPKPQMNAALCGYEVDALFEAEKVIVELDGWGFHFSRTAFEEQRERDADTAAAGFLTVRLTRERFDHRPRIEASRLHRILARRRKPSPA